MPERGETYIRFHDSAPDHYKVEGLSDAAFRLWVETLCWCSRQRNDGRFELVAWHRRGSAKTRRELETAGLVTVTEALTSGASAVRYQVVMHDWLYWQRSNEQVTERREKRRRAGSLGNHKRWHLGKDVVDPECEHCTDDRTCDRNGIANGSQVGSQTDRKRVAEQNRAEQRSTSGDLGGKASVEQRARERAPEGDAPSGGQRSPRGPDVYAQTAHSGRAHRLVEDYAKTCRRRPPSRVLAKLGVEVDALLAENWSTDEIAAALTALGRKGLAPGALASVAHELANSDRDDALPRDVYKIPDDELTDDDVDELIGPLMHRDGPPVDVMDQGVEAMRAWNIRDIARVRAERRATAIRVRATRLAKVANIDEHRRRG